MGILKAQTLITKIFLWTSPIAIGLLLGTNFPAFEKAVWTHVASPVLALVFVAWLISLIFVIASTFLSTRYKEEVLNDVVLRKDRDERETLLSGQAAKKSILITLAASIFILICTTAQYNKAATTEKSSITIGHFRLSDDTPTTTQAEDGSTIVHHQLPMSKMSLVLLFILIQLASYHTINFINLRKSES